jgi:hypothetical protein
MDLAVGSVRAGEGTRRVKRTGTRPRVVVTADGRGVVGRAGTRLLADLADVTGLSTALGEALLPLRQPDSGRSPASNGAPERQCPTVAA